MTKLCTVKLCKFCGDTRTTNRPFYHGGYTYYTNDFYILRVAGKAEDARLFKEIEDKDFIRRCVQIFPTPFDLGWMRHAPHTINPTWPINTCDDCRGRGIVKKCPHCAGEGKVEFEKDRYTYKCVCQMCDGHGVVPLHRDVAGAQRCSRCQGFGDEIFRGAMENLGTARLNVNLMHRLSRLPLIIWTAGEINGHFFFFGGEGVLFGQKPQEECSCKS